MADHDKSLQLFATRFSAQEAFLETFLSYLSEEERMTSAQKINTNLKNQSVLSFGLRRKCLGKILQVDPSSLSFKEIENKKPALVNYSYHFNVSHSDDYWTMCACENSAVGVDIEDVQRSVETLELAQRFFHEEEAAYIKTHPTSFWEFWTAKEAILKAMGEGITGGLSHIKLERCADGKMIYPGWKLIRCEVFPKTILMIAIENKRVEWL